MRPKTPAERKHAQRERDKLRKEEREARLLAYRLKLDVYHGTAERLNAVMQAVQIDEPQDIITRLIHSAARLPSDQLRELLRQP